MYLRIFKVLVFIIALGFSGLRAQQFTSSPYSRYGIGDIFSGGTGHNIATGGACIAENTPYYLNTVNPAANTQLPLQRFVFDVGFDLKFTSMESLTQSQKNSNATFRYLAAGFAVKPWWTFTFGISPYSAVGYFFQDTVKVSSGKEERKYLENFQGKGGLSQVNLSTSFKFLEMFSFGLRGKYVFGNIERRDSVITLVSGYESYSSGFNNYVIRGFVGDFGLLAEKSFNSKKDSSKNVFKASAGFFYSGTAKLKYRSEFLMTSYNTLTANRDTVANDTLYDGKIIVPKSFGVGLSMEFFDKLTVNADYKYQDWKYFKMPSQENVSCFKENKFYALGVQFVSAKFSSRYYKTINYRFGIHKNETYLSLDGYAIEDKGVSFGLGFPIRSLLLNVSFDMGSRGTTEHNLYKEKYFLLHFNVTAHDVWFVKRKFQ